MLQVNANYSKSQLPYEIGSSPFLKSLTLSITDVDEVPKIIGKLPCLWRLELTAYHKIQELLALPISLNLKLLCVVLDLSNLTDLTELDLDDSGEKGGKLVPVIYGWIGRL